ITADNVVVTDKLPIYLDILDATTTRGTVSIEGQSLYITIGSVAPNDLIFIRVRTRINALAQPSVGYNTAILSSSTDADSSNNTSTVSFVILPNNLELPATPVPVPPSLPNTGVADQS